jgi:hypothetical protein
VKPSDLRPGHRIACPLPNFNGALTVIAEPDLSECGPESAARYKVEYRPEDDQVEVDVEPEDTSHRWMADNLPAATGARMFQCLSVRPLRYRLFFHPDTDVKLEES